MFQSSDSVLIFLIASVFTLHDKNAAARPQTISLEYKPNRPFYHPKPGKYPTQIIPEGPPWPASLEGYANFSQTTKRPTTLDLDSRFKETTTVPSNRPPFLPDPGNNVEPLVPPGKPLPANAEDYANFSQTTQPITKPPAVNLENKNQETATPESNRPPFHPNPGNNIGQIVPEGQPWPANAEDYANFSQTSPPPPLTKPQTIDLDNRVKETTTTPSNRPPFHPNPGNNIGQIVPEGQPWPANAEDYANFTQTTRRPQAGNLDNRNQDSQAGLSSRPSFHPNPGSNVGQIVPPGKPWPATAEDYANFSQTNQPSDLNRPVLIELNNTSSNSSASDTVEQVIPSTQNDTDSTPNSTLSIDEIIEAMIESDLQNVSEVTTLPVSSGAINESYSLTSPATVLDSNAPENRTESALVETTTEHLFTSAIKSTTEYGKKLQKEFTSTISQTTASTITTQQTPNNKKPSEVPSVSNLLPIGSEGIFAEIPTSTQPTPIDNKTTKRPMGSNFRPVGIEDLFAQVPPRNKQDPVEQNQYEKPVRTYPTTSPLDDRFYEKPIRINYQGGGRYEIVFTKRRFLPFRFTPSRLFAEHFQHPTHHQFWS